jgi:hypothetical protein
MGLSDDEIKSLRSDIAKTGFVRVTGWLGREVRG